MLKVNASASLITSCHIIISTINEFQIRRIYTGSSVPGTALQGRGITCNEKQAQSRASSLYNRKAQSQCGRSAACSHAPCLFLGCLESTVDVPTAFSMICESPFCDFIHGNSSCWGGRPKILNRAGPVCMQTILSFMLANDRRLQRVALFASTKEMAALGFASFGRCQDVKAYKNHPRYHRSFSTRSVFCDCSFLGFSASLDKHRRRATQPH